MNDILYVLGGRLPPDYHEVVGAGQSPRSEFGVFVERNRARLVSLADVPAPRTLPGRRLAKVQDGRLRLAWWASGKGHAAVVTSGEDIGLPLALATLRHRRPYPVLIVVHGFFIESPKFRIMLGLLKHARHVHLLCLSQALRDSIVERFGFPPSRCHATGYGVDTAFFSPKQPASPDSPLIASAGAANRDYPTLVAAVESLEIPVRIAAASVWIAGPSGLESTPLPSFVEARSYGNYVNLRGLYASASMIVVPLLPVTFASGYAVIAEAMAMGRPVIATRTAVPSDFIVDGETGIYVEPGDVAGMKAAIESLLADPARAEAMGRAARVRMEELFSLSSYSARIEAIIGQAQAELQQGRKTA